PTPSKPLRMAVWRQPHLTAARHWNHLRRLIFASEATITATVEASIAPVIRIRTPPPNSISIESVVLGRAGAAPGPGTTATGENVGAVRSAAHSCCRHRNNWLT